MKSSFWNKIIKSGKQKKWQIGASLVEYGLLVALIAVVAIPSVREVGWKTACKNALASAALGLTQDSWGIYNVYFGRCGPYSYPHSDNTLTRWNNQYCRASWTSPTVQTWRSCFL